MVTHQLQVERRTAKAHRPKTNTLPLDHATNGSPATAVYISSSRRLQSCHALYCPSCLCCAEARRSQSRRSPAVRRSLPAITQRSSTDRGQCSKYTGIGDSGVVSSTGGLRSGPPLKRSGKISPKNYKFTLKSHAIRAVDVYFALL